MLHFDEQVSERITEDVIALNDLIVRMYLIKIDSGYIAIDTGYFESFLKKGLEYNNISFNEIKYVFLTHSDADHVNNLKLFKNAKIFFSEKEKKMLDNRKQRFTFLPFYTNEFNVNKFSLLNDGDEIKIANRKIKCISLPGHTDGSIGYIIDNKYLFSGDAFRIKNGRIDLPFKKQFVMDINEMKSSLKKVASLDSIRFIFSSHSGFTADFKFAVSPIKSLCEN